MVLRETMNSKIISLQGNAEVCVFKSLLVSCRFSRYLPLRVPARLHLFPLSALSSSVYCFDDPDISLTFLTGNLHGFAVYKGEAVVIHLPGLLPGNIVGEINFAKRT